jgi:hypothetical protein
MFAERQRQFFSTQSRAQAKNFTEMFDFFSADFSTAGGQDGGSIVLHGRPPRSSHKSATLSFAQIRKRI